MIPQLDVALLLGALVVGAVPVPVSSHGVSASDPTSAIGKLPPLRGVPVVPTPVSTRLSLPVPGLGARLSRRIRRDGPLARQRFVALGLARAQVEARGGLVTSEVGPISSGELPGQAILELAPGAALIDAPAPLHLSLDVARLLIRANVPHDGRGLPTQYRGKGAIIAAYDSGLDLLHPDLRQLDGPSRAIGLWDQTQPGTPPDGFTQGRECSKTQLARGDCATQDTAGHGTMVVSIAAGSGPQYRGVAPDSEIVMARSADFELLIDTLSWFQTVARREEMPMVVNLSVGGHEGPHDGTSLECRAIDAYPHLVVAAAGNQGTTPVHARITGDGTPRHAALRFPVLREPRNQSAVVDIWGGPDTSPVVRALVMDPSGTILARSSTVTLGAQPRTDRLQGEDRTFGSVDLDAEAGKSPLNGKTHVRVELDLEAWQDAPAGKGLLVIEVAGSGTFDLWVDTPQSQPAPVSFDDAMALALASAVRGDESTSVSDIATAVSAVATSAFTSRVEYPGSNGTTVHISGTVGELSSFSSYGPTLAPEQTGEKPDLAAPGLVVVGARSQSDVLEDGSVVSPLYRAGAGTSLAAPFVAGTAALILAAAPSTTKADLKKALLDSAQRDETVTRSGDGRWGAGKLDTQAAVSLALGVEPGCTCSLLTRAPGTRETPLGLVLLGLVLLGRDRASRAARRGRDARAPSGGARAG